MEGRTISRYRILEKLGEGGMGVVYKAEDKKLHRTVALKFIRPDAVENAELKARFLNEAEAAALCAALRTSSRCMVIDNHLSAPTGARQALDQSNSAGCAEAGK